MTRVVRWAWWIFCQQALPPLLRLRHPHRHPRFQCCLHLMPRSSPLPKKFVCVCVYVCVCVCVRACVRACVRVCVIGRENKTRSVTHSHSHTSRVKEPNLFQPLQLWQPQCVVFFFPEECRCGFEAAPVQAIEELNWHEQCHTVSKLCFIHHHLPPFPQAHRHTSTQVHKHTRAHESMRMHA